ncbi:MAG: hypothetical protein ACO29O_00435 [Chitinophagaceae bacterium]
MYEEFKHLNQEDALKAENDYIKMKLMLEHGAEIQYSENLPGLSPETEQKFLHYIMDYEQKEAMAREMTVFDILGKPQHFPDVNGVADEDIAQVLKRLLEMMKRKGIEVSVFSPNVSKRELYRFITRELFFHRMLYINMEGMRTCFIYDEFHPDHEYENSKVALNDCIKEIFGKKEIQWTFQYEQQITLNNHIGLGLQEFRKLINKFKSKFRHIKPLKSEVSDCTISAEKCMVSGTYEVCFSTDSEHWLKTGIWSVVLRYWKDLDIWLIAEIKVDGMQFE